MTSSTLTCMLSDAGGSSDSSPQNILWSGRPSVHRRRPGITCCGSRTAAASHTAGENSWTAGENSRPKSAASSAVASTCGIWHVSAMTCWTIFFIAAALLEVAALQRFWLCSACTSISLLHICLCQGQRQGQHQGQTHTKIQGLACVSARLSISWSSLL